VSAFFLYEDMVKTLPEICRRLHAQTDGMFIPLLSGAK